VIQDTLNHGEIEGWNNYAAANSWKRIDRITRDLSRLTKLIRSYKLWGGGGENDFLEWLESNAIN